MSTKAEEDALLGNEELIEEEMNPVILDEDDSILDTKLVDMDNGPPAKKLKIEPRVNRHTPTVTEARVTRRTAARAAEEVKAKSEESSERAESGDGEVELDDNDEEFDDGDVEGEEVEHDDEGEDEQEDEDEEMTGEIYEDEHHDLLDDSNGRIKVGDEYQACIQISSPEELNEIPDRDQLIWVLPPGDIPDEDLLPFVEMAMGVYHLTYDRALFVLHQCNYDFERAVEKVRKRRMVIDEWSEDDRNVFRQSFAHYGKNFRKIRQALPHRSMNSVIAFYYNTKKEQQYKELYAGKNVHSDSDRDDDPDEGEEGPCENCGDKEGKLRHISIGRLCRTCRVYHSITNRHRPTSFRDQNLPDPCDIAGRRELAKCPAEMVEVAAEFEQMVRELGKEMEKIKKEGSPEDQKDVVVHRTPTTMAQERNDEVKKEIFRIRSRCMRIQAHLKQQQDQSLRSGVDKFRYLLPKDTEKERETYDERPAGRRQRMAYTWTEKEKLMVFHCLARYGIEYDIIADIVQTKSADQIKSFYFDIKTDVDEYLRQVEMEEERQAKLMNMEKEVGIEIDCVEID